MADSFEVMTAARSYKKPMSVPAARRELAACAGEQFDPAIVRAFLNVSLGRLWWTVGPMSWTALAPILGPLQRAGGQLAGAATGATAAAAVGVASLLPVMTGTGTSIAPVSARAAAQSVPASGMVASQMTLCARAGSGSNSRGGRSRRARRCPRLRPGSDSGDEPADDGGSGGPAEEGRHSAVSSSRPPSGRSAGSSKGRTETVDGVVDGAGETVSGVVDGTTDVVDDLLGGGGVSDLVDEPVEDLTDLLGGLLGS